MRDISAKITTLRTATAKAVLRAAPETIRIIRDGQVPKGDPLPIAKVAAIQAAKNTSQIIPYCHPMPIEFVGVEFDVRDHEIEVRVTVKAIYKTGVEMEALTGASAAALTLYDMLKMLDEEMEILGIVLLEKRGGKSDFRRRPIELSAAVLVMSDRVAAGLAEDRSGKAIAERLEQLDIPLVGYEIVPDVPEAIEQQVRRLADELKVDLLLTTGGTGLSPHDRTPETLVPLFDREIAGIAETLRRHGQDRMPYSMLSRGVAGLRGNTLIVSLPGSASGVRDALDALFPAALHAIEIVRGGDHNSSVS